VRPGGAVAGRRVSGAGEAVSTFKKRPKPLAQVGRKAQREEVERTEMRKRVIADCGGRCVARCRAHHDWISENASRARERGFSFFSWDWEAALKRVAQLKVEVWTW
jgi:hypothetical protein